ncbi:hypothetical protein [Ruania rhizosphaerae]|nr:hypothetical protein [Ruania rhizosphaerae]
MLSQRATGTKPRVPRTDHNLTPGDVVVDDRAITDNRFTPGDLVVDTGRD